METHHIGFIRCVADNRTISAAARELGITQPALTKIVSRVEDVLGAKLFERGSRGVKLTPMGELFLQRMEKVEREMNNLANAINTSKQGFSGTIKLGVGQFWLGRILPQVIARLYQTAPEIQVKIKTGPRDDLLVKLRKGEIDYLLGRITDDLPPGYSGEALAEVNLFLVMREGHPILTESHQITPEILNHFGWILPPPGDPTIRYAFAERGIEPPVPAVEAVSNNMVLGLLRAGDYVTIMPEITCSRHSDGLRRIKADWLGWSRDAGIIRMKDRALLPCCDRFAELLREEVANPTLFMTSNPSAGLRRKLNI